MRWVAIGRPVFGPRIEQVRNELALAEPGVLADSWEELSLPTDLDGFVLVGTDHDLSRLAARTRLPICLVPVDRSDVLRMFGLEGADLRHRIEHGTPYPADLGFASNGLTTVPFVAHWVASRTGRLPAASHRLRELTIDRGGRVSQHRATGVVVVNAQHVAGETIAPRSALMDGTADLQVFGGPWRERVAQRRRRRRGLHLTPGGVVRRRLGEALIEIPLSWSVATDGETQQGRRWTVHIEPDCWALWV